jgi:hypothetical protein
MKFILIWWVIHPGHAQFVHFERFADETACAARANDLLAAGNVRAHCSHE